MSVQPHLEITYTDFNYYMSLDRHTSRSFNSVNRGKRLLRSARVKAVYQSGSEGGCYFGGRGGYFGGRAATSAAVGGRGLRRQGAAGGCYFGGRGAFGSESEGTARIVGLLRHHEPARTPIQRVQNSGLGILDQNSTKSRILDLERPTTIFWTLPTKLIPTQICN
jgi:hypothetical protein